MHLQVVGFGVAEEKKTKEIKKNDVNNYVLYVTLCAQCFLKWLNVIFHFSKHSMKNMFCSYNIISVFLFVKHDYGNRGDRQEVL